LSETLGSLVDKLFTVDHKLWEVQAKVHHAAQRLDPLDAETVKNLDQLNKQRNSLMTELDELFAAGLASGKTVVDSRPKF